MLELIDHNLYIEDENLCSLYVIDTINDVNSFHIDDVHIKENYIQVIIESEDFLAIGYKFEFIEIVNDHDLVYKIVPNEKFYKTILRSEDNLKLLNIKQCIKCKRNKKGICHVHCDKCNIFGYCIDHCICDNEKTCLYHCKKCTDTTYCEKHLVVIEKLKNLLCFDDEKLIDDINDKTIDLRSLGLNEYTVVKICLLYNIDFLKKLVIDLYIDINAIGERGYNVLHHFVLKEDIESIKKFLYNCGNVNSVDLDKKTVIMKNTDMIYFFVKHKIDIDKIDVDKIDCNRQNVLHKCIFEDIYKKDRDINYYKYIMLFKNRVNYLMKDFSGKTPLDYVNGIYKSKNRKKFINFIKNNCNYL